MSSQGHSKKQSDWGRLFLASGFGLGLLPGIPGTFGALSGLAIQCLILSLTESHAVLWFACCTAAVLFSVLHYFLTPWAQNYWNDSDPSHFVLDEIVGALCVPMFLGFHPNLWWIFAGFAVFRVFDAIKLPGAAYIDTNIHTASGVLFDDVVSAMYTGGFLTGLYYFGV